jgi:hypothetical protein
VPPAISPCPDCGARRVGAPVYGGVGVGRRSPRGLHHVTDLRVLVCTGCGKVDLYAAGLNALRHALDRHPDGFSY